MEEGSISSRRVTLAVATPDRKWGRRCIAAAGLLCSLAAPSARAAILSDVTLTPAFFNPSLGQSQSIRLAVKEPGSLRVDVLDRDRHPIRSWTTSAQPGALVLNWDGKDDAGAVVPDEAYHLRLEFRGEGVAVAETYDPSANFHPAPSNPTVNYYSPASGVLGYTLKAPSRVHAQAGQARLDPKTKQMAGPVLKTLVDNAPRVGGPVIEKWTGMDEGGTFSVAALEDFVVAILATELPPSTMITVGNRSTTFFEYARTHRGPAATRPRDLRSSRSQHHQGLTALEDRTPPLRVEPSGRWDPATREWTVSAPIRFSVTVTGDGAPYFLGLPTELVAFVDETAVLHLAQPKNPVSISLGADQVPVGKHRIAVNWQSRLGPTAVGAFVVNVVAGPSRPNRSGR